MHIRRLALQFLLLWLLCSSAMAEGQVELHFLKPESPTYEKTRAHLKSSKYMTVIPLSLDNTFRFPRKLKVIYGEIGRANAFYTREKHAVVIGYELHETLVKMFMNSGKSRKKSLQAADYALAHIILHEFGHALIGELELPITGREEDCADEFATIWSSKVFEKQGTAMALNSAHFFLLASRNSRELKDLHFWDEHSLNRQRFYHIISDLNASLDEDLPGVEKIIPAERIQEAKARFPRKELSWLRLLTPHFHKDFDLVMLKPRGPSEGHLKTEFGPLPADAGTFLEVFWGSDVFATLVEGMDEAYYWPRDFTVRFEIDPKHKTRYQRKAARIIIDLSFMKELGTLLSEHPEKKESYKEMFLGALLFRVLQGVSEALIQELELPWTGEQEDVTSEFMTIMLSDKNDRGQTIIRGMASFHLMLSKKDKKMADLDLWEAGPLDQQRFIDLLGYLHASDPQAYQFVEEMIPARRRARYKRELPLKKKRWATLLAPYKQKNIWK